MTCDLGMGRDVLPYAGRPPMLRVPVSAGRKPPYLSLTTTPLVLLASVRLIALTLITAILLAVVLRVRGSGHLPAAT